MIEYMLLGAWLLVLMILGAVVAYPDSPDELTDDAMVGLWIIKILYLAALSVTTYQMGAHFGGM